MTFIGDLERAFASLIFPNLLPLSILFAIGLVGLAVLARGRGWDGVVRRHGRASLILLAVLLIVGLPIGAYLTGPLFTRTELVEAAPVAASGTAGSSPSVAAIASPAVVPSVVAATATPQAPVAPSPAPSPSAPAPTTPPSAAPSPPPSPPATARPSPTTSPPAVPAFPIARAQGTFVGADDFHFGRGRALIIETAPGTFVVRFEAFSVRNGPDLHVFLSPDPDGYAKGAAELGVLKATDGAFNYLVPATVDVGAAKSVVVWCLTFGVQFAHAELSAD